MKDLKEVLDENSESIEDNEQVSKDAAILSLAKDLVELAIQSQKVLASSAIPFALIEEAKLLALMSNEVLSQYTNANELNEEESADE